MTTEKRPPTVVIRPFVAADHEALRALCEELDTRHRQAAPWLFMKPEREPRPPGHFESRVQAGSAAVLVADDGDSVVGHIIMAVREPPPFPVFKRQRLGVIDDLAVLHTHRRRGIGTKLLRAGEEWLISAGASVLELNVYEFNVEARAFYEAVGYAPLLTRMQKPLDQ